MSIACDDADESPYDFDLSATGAEWHGIQTVDSADYTGQHPSMARFGTTVFLSYYECHRRGPDVCQVHRLGATWPAANIRTVDSTGNVGLFTSMKLINSGNTIYLSYCDATNHAIKLAKSTDGGATWPAANIKTVAPTGSNVGFGFLRWPWRTASASPILDSTNYDLKVARSTDGGVSWPAVTVDSTGVVGFSPSLAVNGGNVYVSYADGSGNLKFAKSTDYGATWPAGNIKILSDNGGSDNALFCESPYLYVCFFDPAASYLRFKKSADSGATWLAEVVVDTGGEAAVPSGRGEHALHRLL